ncbi:MAG: DNA alkylation repair protein [Planctomycetaceae bacterium]|nr:DNA alkylation repair protein [Planctomycetaceae bacterium]
MDLETVMEQLKSLGTAQNVKTYQRHGAGSNVFGVSFADLRKLAKKISTNHDLAVELWDTGNTDARSLAMMIADPDEVTPTLATQWMKDVDYYLHGTEVAAVVARSEAGLSKMRQWRKQKSEYARATGYAILTCMLKDDPDSIDDDECLRIIKDIELEIHRSPNRARHAMVMAVIAIGVYKRDLSDDAMEAGERIGVVEVDHGDTDCTTPGIKPYIAKTLKRSAKTGKVSLRG